MRKLFFSLILVPLIIAAFFVGWGFTNNNVVGQSLALALGPRVSCEDGVPQSATVWVNFGSGAANGTAHVIFSSENFPNFEEVSQRFTNEDRDRELQVPTAASTRQILPGGSIQNWTVHFPNGSDFAGAVRLTLVNASTGATESFEFKSFSTLCN